MIGHLNLARGFRGGERQTELLIKGLAQHAVAQRLVCRADEPLAASVRDTPGVEIADARGSLWRAARLTRGCELAHVHDGRSVHAASLARTLFRVPYIITRRVDNPIKRNAFTRRAYLGAAQVVALSRAIEDQVMALDADIQCCKIADATAGYTQAPEAVAAIRARYPGRFVVGHVGALDHAHKGQLDLIDAARQLAVSHPNIQVVLLGSGRDEALFAQRAADLSNVDMPGFVDNVGDYLAAFDAFVFPSLHEGMGSTLLDAMTFSLPIVATKVGGIVDLIEHGHNGLLVAPAQPAALAAALARVHDDPSLARDLGESGCRFAQDFSPAAMTQRYLAQYARAQKPNRPTETL